MKDGRGNKKTKPLTEEQYREIITTIRTGGINFRPNDKIATALTLEAALGLRISDILQLKLSDIKRSGDRYHLDIVEQKTGKSRVFTVPARHYLYMKDYCDRNGIEDNEEMFPKLSDRGVHKYLAKVCDYLGDEYEDVSTHSFRKFYATNVYTQNGYDIVLVQKLLQHSSPAITQRYIGIESAKVEAAIENHLTELL